MAKPCHFMDKFQLFLNNGEYSVIESVGCLTHVEPRTLKPRPSRSPKLPTQSLVSVVSQACASMSTERGAAGLKYVSGVGFHLLGVSREYGNIGIA